MQTTQTDKKLATLIKLPVKHQQKKLPPPPAGYAARLCRTPEDLQRQLQKQIQTAARLEALITRFKQDFEELQTRAAASKNYFKQCLQCSSNSELAILVMRGQADAAAALEAIKTNTIGSGKLFSKMVEDDPELRALATPW